jgi:hypothetical protein
VPHKHPQQGWGGHTIASDVWRLDGMALAQLIQAGEVTARAAVTSPL